jgi:hypothetical protein
MWRFIKKTRARIDAGQSTAPPKNNQLFKEWIIQNPHIVVRFHSFFCLISYVLGSLCATWECSVFVLLGNSPSGN